MRIVFLIQDTGKVYGAEKATLDLAAGLRDRGADVVFLLIAEARMPQDASAFRDALRARNLESRALPVRGRFSFRLVYSIRSFLREYQADVLHSTGYKADVHGSLATKAGSILPHVSTVHGWLERPDFKERFYARVNLWALRRCTRVVALSRYYEEKLVTGGIPRERIVRIPTGIDVTGIKVREQWPVGPRPVFGMLGRLSWEKNHAMFLRAARDVMDSGADADFLIAGDGPEQSNIERLIRELDLGQRVRLMPYMPTDHFFGQIDVLVVCSRIENLPMVILEAMARGLPVIATRVGGVPDLVRDGVTGKLVDSGDSHDLALCIRRALADGSRALDWGRAGRRSAESDFVADRATEGFRQILGGVVRK